MDKQIPTNYWSMTSDAMFTSLKTSSKGLTSNEAASRLNKYGRNSFQDQKQSSVFFLLLNQFKNPIIIILLIATAISAFTGDWIDSAIILSIIFASAILSFFQEYSAGNAIAELRAKVQVESSVLRDGKLVNIAAANIVPGDIVSLSTGSLVPADGVLFESASLYINQSILTGESLPSEKNTTAVAENASLEDRDNTVFMGTSVQSGNAMMVVTETGKNTEFGHIAHKLTMRTPETEFERGIRHFGYLLTQIMLILTLAVFAINVIMNKPAIDSLLFSVALAVGITPQLLPTIISITLSKGSRSMAKEGVIVRRLTAIENFGSMDTLCTDKTGTLTEGVIRLHGAIDILGQASDKVYRLAYLNASLQTGMANTMDEAIRAAKKLDLDNVRKTGEISFDFTRKRLSVIVEENGQLLMIAKGALNSILSVCTQVETDGQVKDLDETILEAINTRYAEISNQGIRVLGVAQKPTVIKNKYTVDDESEMIFTGFLLLLDHPKADVAQTIGDLARNGVGLRVITGDNKLIALHTADSVGLKVSGLLTGSELMKLNDNALMNKVAGVNLFAEVDPNQKERIILALKKAGHVVGYMGDGINDVPALHAADVSITVENAVDIAKESADFVLMENSLAVLNRGIELGRRTFSNTLKYILVTTSANFGNMFSMAGVSLLLPFLPLLPKQILIINFFTDFPAITLANDSVDAEILRKPRRWDIHFIRDFMFIFGLISSVFDYMAFGVLLFFFKTPEELFQSSWFIFSIITELLMLIVMRTHKPFFKSKPAPLLLYSSAAVGLLTLILPYLPFHQLFNLEPVSPWLLLSLFAVLVLYTVAIEIGKHYFFKYKSHANQG